MRPIFTIHAGEFVFGEEIEKRFKDRELWIPAKDKGVDFLVTRPKVERPIAVQVKMSRDYRKNVAESLFDEAQIAGGWFKFSKAKIENSPADVWSLILISRERRTAPLFINITPKKMLQKLKQTYGDKNTYDLYPWIMRLPVQHGNASPTNICVEGRGLKKDEREQIVKGHYSLGPRDWSDHLNDWSMFA